MACQHTSTKSHVDLGFVEKCEAWRLLSHFFPSKVGGKPAWLALHPLPKPDELKCGECGKPCVFLLQVYADLSDKPSCFHRTLFLFICPNSACCRANSNKNLLVFRSQLSRNNKFYSYDPPDEDSFNPGDDFPSADKFQGVCVVCGGAGPKKCSKCHQVAYCDREHQAVDWKAGHKLTCQDGSSSKESKANILFPEYELVTEEEECDEKGGEETTVTQDDEGETTKPSILEGKKSLADLEAMARHETAADIQMQKFKQRVSKDKDQVLRYSRGGEPLWISSEHIPAASDLPNCSCGAEREFEFQVMPQLLRHLQVDQVGDSIDWGTLAVYTCRDSCDSQTVYCPEFVWKQDIVETDADKK